uniref:Kelch like family member 10 n=1 Tax=Gouania willdenowi TaxID=441366 RepID=A0A8C5DSI7_GOUWI
MIEVHQFNVKSLEQTCFEALKDHLCPEKCIGLWQFTKVWYIPILFQLKNEAFHFICENFEEVSLCEEFLQLEVQELADILGQDDLTVTQESTVYQSVLRWINHMPEERQGAISTLLPKVRLELMDKSYITDNVLNNDVVKTNPESHLLVSDTLKVMSQPSLLCSESGINNTLFFQTNLSLENPMTHLLFYSTVFLGRCFYIVGGGLSWTDPCIRLWRFNLVTHTWQQMSPMQESRYLMSVTVLKGCIYAMGGYRDDDGTLLRTAERYQPNINQWTFIASMNEERISASCSTLNNKIYICGGWNNIRSLNTAEYYNPDTNQWTLITPMGTPRCGLGVITYMGHIFAVGGRDGSRRLRSAEAYDPVTNTCLEDSMTHLFFYSTVFLGRCFYIVGGGLRWTNPSNRVWRFNLVTHTWQEMSPMQESRALMSVTVLKGYIYAMGGCRDDDVISHRTAERYQPNINQWTFIASMNEERIRASCTTLNNKIYICGGCSNRSLNTAEYYNPDTNQSNLYKHITTSQFTSKAVF